MDGLTRRTHRSPRRRPCGLEPLEDRLLLAASFFADLSGSPPAAPSSQFVVSEAASQPSPNHEAPAESTRSHSTREQVQADRRGLAEPDTTDPLNPVPERTTNDYRVQAAVDTPFGHAEGWRDGGPDTRDLSTDRDGPGAEYREHALARQEKVVAIVLPCLVAGERTDAAGQGSECGPCPPVPGPGGRGAVAPESPLPPTPARSAFDRATAPPAVPLGSGAAPAIPAEGPSPEPPAEESGGGRTGPPVDRLAGEDSPLRVEEPGAGVPEAGVLPFDLRGVERRVDQFFSRLGRLGEADSPTRGALGLTTWTALAAAVALEVVRSRAQRAAGAAVPGLPREDR
jgi:hypothetical protein